MILGLTSKCICLNTKNLLIIKAIQREESYEEQIRDISARLKDVSIIF
jgi:hypothetical protein